MELGAQSELRLLVPCPSARTSTATTLTVKRFRQMGIAFEMALASLGATPGCDDPIRTALAQRIIVLAQAGERDPECLCEGALQVGSPAVHRDSAGVQPER